MTFYKYGMLIRGYDKGCQPEDGFVKRVDSPNTDYLDIIYYDRKLSSEEMKQYSLNFLGEEPLSF